MKDPEDIQEAAEEHNPVNEVLSAPVDLNALQKLGQAELFAMAAERRLHAFHDSSKHHLVFEIIRDQLKRGGIATAEGILEFAPDAPMIRWAVVNFQPTPSDLTLPVSLLRQYELRPGLKLAGTIGLQTERRLSMSTITCIEGIPV